MTPNLQAAFDRADEIIRELEVEYRQSLAKKNISARTQQLCHDALEKLRSGLDRAARLYWERHIRPQLSQTDVDAATIYFPIAVDDQAFSSIMGRWRWKTVKQDHQNLENYLRSLQPFTNADNKWLILLSDIVNEGKHVDLSPQTRVESRTTTLTSPHGGSVSYTSGVVFGSGVSIMGVPVDPRTQKVVPNNILKENVTIWVDFKFSKHGASALSFMKEATVRSRQIAEHMSSEFGLN